MHPRPRQYRPSAETLKGISRLQGQLHPAQTDARISLKTKNTMKELGRQTIKIATATKVIEIEILEQVIRNRACLQRHVVVRQNKSDS